MLEKALEDLTAAVNGLRADLAGGKTAAGSAAATTKAAGTTKAATTKAAGPKNTVESVAAAAAKVKAQFGKEGAVHLISTIGEAAKLADMKPARYDAFVQACEAALESGEIEGFGETAAEDDI